LNIIKLNSNRLRYEAIELFLQKNALKGDYV